MDSKVNDALTSLEDKCSKVSYGKSSNIIDDDTPSRPTKILCRTENLPMLKSAEKILEF
jgi:hypothetical protein